MILLTSLALGILILCFHTLTASHEPNEPPLIRPGIPIVGHLIGMIRHGSGYYSKINKKYNLPIYTLPMPRGKVYIVNSPRLIAAIDRRAKTISFAPYVVQFAKRILAPSQQAISALEEDLLEKQGPVGLRPETLKVMHDSLAPGGPLEDTTQVMLEGVMGVLNSMRSSGKCGEIELFDWTRRLVTKASTDAIYGAKFNPFKDEGVYNGLWTIDKDFVLLGLNVLSNFMTPRGSQARTSFFNAMRAYYDKGGHEYGSRLVRDRYEVSLKHRLSRTDIEHFNLSVSYGLLVNTVPATAWTLFHVYSNPLLLREIRHDIESRLGRLRTHAIEVNIPTLIEDCPLLMSLVQEVLRIHSTNASGRVVLDDTLIDDEYLLKKDAILLIPSADLHSNQSIWGSNATALDPRRFMNQREPTGKQKVPACAYRAFGSGASVCPGRHFAMNEILSILVVMVLKYDMSPVQGEWTMPKTKSHITTSILTPAEDLKVEMRERECMKDLELKLVWRAEKSSRR
ncbi:cytochrome P450 [Xylaria bambusicola]|uniref:cytochrome P450 n=1 Tax=Xylaria bambusicola TaxID=326684 RepID=UPI002008AC37|nr:cytochrome P450 [Xylaria bambusicola]KAI0513191.1 cytochrome P450 [Xylaria bambusicola]